MSAAAAPKSVPTTVPDAPARAASAPVTRPAPTPAPTPAAAPDAPPPAADVAPSEPGESQVAAGLAPVPGAGPATDAAPLIVRAAATDGLVVLLVLLVILFLAMHGRVDRGDPKLAAIGDSHDRARFR